jgi:alkylation response protein AidB-like acyl-CoA dehydrogenase
MDLTFTESETAFRDELRRWLADNPPPPAPEGGGEDESFAWRRDWQRKLYDGGWAAPHWPAEYGGRGASLTESAIYFEELGRARVPLPANVLGLLLGGPTLMVWGTDEQKDRFLNPILSAEEIWCQGFSEPDAGSDLSAVRTRIDVHDDKFVLNGQKVWSSFAHIAAHCILVGRSDPDSERHAGLTYVIVDMNSPGVEVRPLRQITGEAEFNEIFLTDVQVPRENLLGEIGGGWQVAMTTLLHERGTLGFALSGVLDAQVRKLIALTKERNGHDPLIRDRVAQEWIELQALKLTNYRSLTTLMKTGMPGPEGSGAKLHWSEQNQRLTKLAMEILDGEDDGYWRHQQLRSRGNTIEAGTSEILRNIIAERVLGLPRSR